MHISFLRGIIALSVTLTLLSGCSDELSQETALGTSFALTDVTIYDTTLAATGSSTFKQFLPMNGRVNLLGKYQGYEARMLMLFYSAFFPNTDTLEVLSARLTLRAETWFGDSTGTVAFTAHKVTSLWNPNFARWDSLPQYETTVRGQYSGFITSDSQKISFALDTALVRDWLRGAVLTQYGLILLPSATASTIRGFNPFDWDSTSHFPTLEVFTRSFGSQVLDTLTFNLGIDTFVGNNDGPVSNPGLLFTQSGIVYRSRLHFDVSFIPFGATVVSASMVLTQDPATTHLNRFRGDSLTVAHLSVSATDSAIFEAQGSLASITASNTYTFNVRHIVQSWAVGTNHGLILRNSNLSEFSSFDLATFHNQLAADSTLRPKLLVKYSVENRRDER